RARARCARAEMHDVRAYLLRLRHPGEHRLEAHARRRVAAVRGDFSGAREKQDRSGVAGSDSLQGADRAFETAEGQRCTRRRNRRRHRHCRNAAGSRARHRRRRQIRPGSASLSLHQLRHGADGPRHRRAQARGARCRDAAREEKAEIAARRGMVTCPHALASAAGVEMLRAGGSTVDAALAAAGVLGVVYPHMCGIGGDAFWLIFDAKEARVAYLDGGGRAAASATLERFGGQHEIPFRGIVPATLTTPGAVASFCEAHARYGRLPFARCLEAAVHYARDGYPVSERLARWITETAADLREDAGSAALFLDGGKTLKNPALARTLEAIAAQGRAGYYEGEIGAALARFSAEHGGFFRASDLAAQTAHWGEAISGRYRGVTIYETPAPTQGFTVLEMLNLIEPLELGPYQGPDHVHLLVQAKQLAYHDRDRWLADPRYARVPIARLISKAYADERRKLIDPTRALAWDDVPESRLTGDTVYVAAVDAEGSAASLIFSLYGVFGACVTDPATGVVLQNRSAYFSLDPAHPNRLEPGKVPLHTLIASLA